MIELDKMLVGRGTVLSDFAQHGIKGLGSLKFLLCKNLLYARTVVGNSPCLEIEIFIL